jgi:hypothetical protein
MGKYQLLLNLPQSFKEPLQIAATAKGVSVTKLVTELIRVYCKQPKQPSLKRGRPRQKVEQPQAETSAALRALEQLNVDDE